MTAWKEILIALGGNATIIIVLAFLARSLVQTWLSKDVKRFEAGLTAVASSELEHLKSELKAGADASLERLRMELPEKAVEHQVRFAKLHERRAEAIQDLYSEIVDTQLAAQRYVYVTGHDESTRPRESPVIHSKLVRLYALIERNRIYLPEHICSLLGAFQESLRKAVTAIDVYAPLIPPTQQAAERAGDALVAAVEAFEGKIPQARKALEDELRAILGDVDIHSSGKS